MPNVEEKIRERAYHLWIADGLPQGQADIYWLNAQREILTTSLEGSSTARHGFGIGHAEARKKGEGHPLRKKQNPRCIVPPEPRDKSVTLTPCAPEGGILPWSISRFVAL